ncbi:MAG TPA: cyclic nucleotide-binding domain-containing protein [Acidimicrobiales bacterium]|jgi:CRP/FNR family transcriptional regulator, cyclic AMP receptor protein|nr:cyclic nucleotide-binding domain-containing protein [Acidimicrobiales bacterium]
MAKPAADVLSTVDLFQSLSKRELGRLMASAKELSFAEGDIIVTEGDEDGRFYLVLEGKARIVKGRRTLATLGAGDYFGEISLIDGEPRSATVLALGPIRALTIARWNFRPLLEEHPAIARKLLLEMCRRVRELDRSPDH